MTPLPHRPRLQLNPEHCIRNRLLSIQADASSILHAVQSMRSPQPAVVANARCGSWYVRPELKGGTVYFKSTDGHKDEWAFSTRRLNLGLLDILGRDGICVVVDSTRDRTFSDAHSKTIPIWCAIMNRLLFPQETEHHGLVTDEVCVPDSEHRDIEARLDAFLVTAKALALDLAALRSAARRPIKPHLYTSNGSSSQLKDLPSSVNHIICLSACSSPSTDADIPSYTYIPGAGDDAECWARGLLPELFWANKTRFADLLSESDFECEIDEIVQQSKSGMRDTNREELPKPIRLTTSSPPFFIGSLDAFAAVEAGRLEVDAAIMCCLPQVIVNMEAAAPKDGVSNIPPRRMPPVLTLRCPSGKEGSRALRTELSRIAPFLKAHFSVDSRPRLLFVSSDGIDLAMAVTLVVTCLHFETSGQFVLDGIERKDLSERGGKAFVRRRLVEIQNHLGHDAVNDEGSGIRSTTLKAVNEFVMGQKPEKGKDICKDYSIVGSQNREIEYAKS